MKRHSSAFGALRRLFAKREVEFIHVILKNNRSFLLKLIERRLDRCAKPYIAVPLASAPAGSRLEVRRYFTEREAIWVLLKEIRYVPPSMKLYGHDSLVFPYISDPK